MYPGTPDTPCTTALGPNIPTTTTAATITTTTTTTMCPFGDVALVPCILSGGGTTTTTTTTTKTTTTTSISTSTILSIFNICSVPSFINNLYYKKTLHDYVETSVYSVSNDTLKSLDDKINVDNYKDYLRLYMINKNVEIKSK